MVFSSPVFLLLFLSLVVVAYYLAPGRAHDGFHCVQLGFRRRYRKVFEQKESVPRSGLDPELHCDGLFQARSVLRAERQCAFGYGIGFSS